MRIDRAWRGAVSRWALVLMVLGVCMSQPAMAQGDEAAKHAAVDRFVTPDEFEDYAKAARGKGFLLVSATPLTRSSYHADRDFAALSAARNAQLAARS